jgi:hypothetical protein
MTEEARLEQLDSGLAPVTDGWFVVNARDAAWQGHPEFGARCNFELGRRVLGERDDLEPSPFPQIGVNLDVFWPGQPSSLYHAETEQEDFLVLAGECVAIVEGQERPLRAWDFLHCPPLAGRPAPRRNRLPRLGARAQVRRRRGGAHGLAGRSLCAPRLLAAGPPGAVGRTAVGEGVRPAGPGSLLHHTD